MEKIVKHTCVSCINDDDLQKGDRKYSTMYNNMYKKDFVDIYDKSIDYYNDQSKTNNTNPMPINKKDYSEMREENLEISNLYKIIYIKPNLNINFFVFNIRFLTTNKSSPYFIKQRNELNELVNDPSIKNKILESENIICCIDKSDYVCMSIIIFDIDKSTNTLNIYHMINIIDNDFYVSFNLYLQYIVILYCKNKSKDIVNVKLDMENDDYDKYFKSIGYDNNLNMTDLNKIHEKVFHDMTDVWIKYIKKYKINVF